MPEMDRRRMMLMTGFGVFGVLGVANPVPRAHADPSRRGAPVGRTPMPAAPAPNGQSTNYVFHDEFDGPAGSAPDSSKWTIARAREQMKDPTYWERP
ncbi:1,3-beta-glucanase, partial [Mycobacterium kansasii]